MEQEANYVGVDVSKVRLDVAVCPSGDMALIAVGIILQRGLDDDDYDTNAIVMMGQTGETTGG